MLDKVSSLKQVWFKSIDEIRDKLLKMNRLFKQDISFEEIQSEVKKF